jgi:hypothetical protein
VTPQWAVTTPHSYPVTRRLCLYPLGFISISSLLTKDLSPSLLKDRSS